MNLTDRLTNFIAKKQQISNLRDQFSPNGWGRQQYEGTFYDIEYNEKIDLNNIAVKKGWIQAYVKMHFEGIKLKMAKSRTAHTNSNISYKKTEARL